MCQNVFLMIEKKIEKHDFLCHYSHIGGLTFLHLESISAFIKNRTNPDKI